MLTEATASATDTDIDAALIRIGMMCNRFTPGDDFSADLQLREYRAAVRAYPADVALFVLQRWPHRHGEWPAWKALQDELDLEYAPRRSLMAALKLIEPYAAPIDDGPTDADVDFVRAKCAETVAKLSAASKDASRAYTAPQSRNRIGGSKLSPNAAAHLKRIGDTPMET